MAKKALLDVLEKTIGKYVCNLDTNSLNVAVWSGKIELHSLELNVGAINAELDLQAAQAPNLALPLRVVDGRFHSLTVDVPWTHLMSKPVILRAKGLQVSVEPVDPLTSQRIAQTSEQSAPQRVHDIRNQAINAANDYRLQANALAKLAEEDLNQQQKEDGKNNNNNNNSDTGFVARLVRRIIENLQIEISDVHVTLLGSVASAGVVLNSLQLTTTDEHGKQTFIDRTSGAKNAFLYKSLVLRGLGAYLDEKGMVKSSGGLGSIGEDEGDGAEGEEGFEHNYVLAPLSFTAKLRQADGNVCIDYPKYLLESELAALSVLLSKTQVDLARKILKEMEPALDTPRPLFPEYRPVGTKVTKENVREWWQYAYRSVGRLNGKRSWVEFFRAFQKRNEYIELYKRHVSAADCAWMAALSSAEKERLESIEDDRSISVEGIMTWRNIADARARKEKEKKQASKPKQSLFGSLFAKPDAKKKSNDEEDDPPIQLSPEELKEMENLTLKDVEAEGGELSKDSRLCDLSFVLGSFTVHLVTQDMRPLSTLKMGTVSTSFGANQNGSYIFDLALRDLTIEDRITPHTLFPEILSHRPRKEDEGANDQAFSIRIEKTKAGDQKLMAKLRTIELVASPILVEEMMNFAASKSSVGPPTTLKAASPMLRQSVTGSVDLFYDATEGIDLSPPNFSAPKPVLSTSNDGDFSHALFDAWKAKTEANALWILDLDLAAPVIVVPEHCSKPSASILVLNLGHMTFRYGNIEASSRVKDWFGKNPYPGKTIDLQYDYGALQISSLTFVVGRAENWKELVRSDDLNTIKADPVLAPITASMDIGVENHSTKPRMAAFLVLPGISGDLSPDQVTRILAVSQTWQKVSASISLDPDTQQKHDDEVDGMSHATAGSASSFQVRAAAKKASRLLLAASSGQSEVFPLFHLDIRLQRISAKLSGEGGIGVEAHLVSVSSSTTTMSNGDAKVQLSMGWFWVLDRLENNFSRVQRLVAHSALPLPAEDFAEKDEYDIMGELERRGVFNDTFEGSSDLADVVIRHSPAKNFGKKDPFAAENLSGDKFAVDTIVDARFTSLHVNWNPNAVKELVSKLDYFTNLLESESRIERGPVIVAQGDSTRKSSQSVDGLERQSQKDDDLCMLVRAQLGGFELVLRSALDDLPLFALSMTKTRVGIAMAAGDESGMRVDASVGNLEAVTSGEGLTCASYRKIVGLAPQKSDSLLTVVYSDGPRAMKHVHGKDGYESYGLVHLSPMRLVYIQSQVLALVDYTTEGILGAITQQAASSAAAAAADLAVAGAGKKLFDIKATGFEVLVPEAAYQERAFTARTGALAVDYEILPYPGGGEAKIALTGLMLLVDDELECLLSEPCALQIAVTIPANGVGSLEDQAMRVRISMSDADLLLKKAEYDQLRTLLDKNIADQQLYLRPGDSQNDANESRRAATRDAPVLSHAGSAVIDNPKRIYTTIVLAGLSLSLFGSSRDDPLIRITTDETRISANLFPNGEKLSTTISMKNLECSDERPKSIGRQYRSLIYQGKSEGDDVPSSLILVEFETNADKDTSLKISVGTPRIVFIPDAVSGLLQFFADDKKGESESAVKASDTSQKMITTTGVDIEDTEGDKGIETKYVVDVTPEPCVSNYSVSFVTSDCYFIFVDLGSTSLTETVTLKSSMIQSATEAFVLKGIFDFRLKAKLDEGNKPLSADAEFHGDGFEAYTAYGGSSDALQVIEPARVSLYASTKLEENETQVVDVRIASVTPVEMCISMKNVALLNAISSGVIDCFQDPPEDLASAQMSQKDADHIEKLASALQNDDVSVSTSLSGAGKEDNSGRRQTTQSRYNASVKLTLPEATVTVVNDLQGLDDALFRVSLLNLVANGSIESGIQDHRLKDPLTAFTANLNCSINSDYFDESSRLWKNLLLKPWEVTLRAQRGMNSRLSARIPSTTCDIESFACQLGFTEQFLVSLASANHMWAVYSAAISGALEAAPQDTKSDRLCRAIAASAARTLVTVLPYVIENHCGRDVEYTLHTGCDTKSTCAHGKMEYFRFGQPKGKGFGGQRLYGQDRQSKNSLNILIGEDTIQLSDIDSMVHGVREAHVLKNDEVVFTNVVKEGKTVVIHISSSVDVKNNSSLPFTVAVEKAATHTRNVVNPKFVGTSHGKRSLNKTVRTNVRHDGRMTRDSSCLGVPVETLKHFHAEWSSFKRCSMNLSISPQIEGMEESHKLVGEVEINLEDVMFRHNNSAIASSFDVTCRSSEKDGGRVDTFVARVKVVASLIREHPFVEICIAPRALILNKIPLSMSIRTPMPHTFSEQCVIGGEDSYDTHHLSPNGCMEIFTPGPSLAVSLRCTDNPVAGSQTDWMEGGWVDLPLVSEFRLPEPFFVHLPYPSGGPAEPRPRRGGTEIVIADKLSPHWDPSFYQSEKAETESVEVLTSSNADEWRTYLIGVSHYAVDHTGEVLFENGEVKPPSVRPSMRRSLSAPASNREVQQNLAPFGGYRSERHHGRITLLPLGRKMIRLLHLTMEGEAGYMKSAPFLVEDIAICEGGVEATSIPWESGRPSGFFTYRRLLDDHQSEVHVIPEYVCYNGSSKHTIQVKQPGHGEVTIRPGKIGHLRSHHEKRLAMSVEFEDFGGRTAPMNVDTAALRFAVVRAPDGHPIGSLAIETVVGGQDSRWVVKVSDIKLGASQLSLQIKEHSIFNDDLLRFRIQWTELRVTLSETKRRSATETAPVSQSMVDQMALARPRSAKKASLSDRPDLTAWVGSRKITPADGNLSDRTNEPDPVCTVMFYRFTVDWQRVFKEEQSGISRGRPSAERSQISLIVHDVQLRDETRAAKYPIVFDSTTKDASFLDLCIRTRGPLSAEMINVHLFDLKISCPDGRASPVVIKLTEEFIWKLLDLSNNIVEAASEFTGYNIAIAYDDDDGYAVNVSEKKTSFIEDESKYTPPSSTTLYEFEKVLVSPVLLLVTFDRKPEKTRYEKQSHIRGAHLVNYFTRQLKFKIDKAELSFGSFQAVNIKGGADRLIELLSTAYLSRLKLKIFSILSAASFQDWKNLASREDGDDKYLEGDIMRVTGNLAGRSTNYILKKAGGGLGDGVRFLTSKVGDGFENAAGAVGARSVGTGVNHVVSGVGQGVGDTLTGIGSGAGKILKGTGQGVGQVFGGVSGGVLQVGKGIGKGLQGDGQAFRSGMTQGASSLGRGVGDGIGSVVGGAADGVATLGKGLFTGVKSIGKGFGSAVTGKPKSKKRNDHS